MKYGIVALGVMLTAMAQVLLKYTAAYELWSRKFILFVVGSMLTYCMAFLAQSYVMRFFPLSKVSPAMSIATMIVVFLCGILLFKEQLLLKQIIGILLGAVSIYLILF